jgi:release factor glutamine methyltransferase
MGEQAKLPTRWTIKDVLEWTADFFKSKGIQTARLDAEVLLGHCLGMDRLALYLKFDRPLRAEERARYRELVRRRSAREPVALITGKKEFWSFSFRIAPGILIPRPDTEILVEAVLEEIRDQSCPRILEIGTGSGAVAVSLARERPDAFVVATDLDFAAVSVAALNAREAGVNATVRFVNCDLFYGVKPSVLFDVICSNPPYIPRADIPTLEPEITKFEPILALDGGTDGLDVIRKLVREAPCVLKPEGSLILEIGEGQDRDVRDIMGTLGPLHDVGVRKDLAGKIRVVMGRR